MQAPTPPHVLALHLDESAGTFDFQAQQELATAVDGSFSGAENLEHFENACRAILERYFADPDLAADVSEAMQHLLATYRFARNAQNAVVFVTGYRLAQIHWLEELHELEGR